MKHIDSVKSYEELNLEFITGREYFKILMRRVSERQERGDLRLSYSGLYELIEALELNEFILDNTDGRVIGA